MASQQVYQSQKAEQDPQAAQSRDKQEDGISQSRRTPENSRDDSTNVSEVSADAKDPK